MSSLTQEQLNKSLWAAADDMRKSMSADDYKDYLLGLVFFKNLSDEILYDVNFQRFSTPYPEVA